MKKAVRWAKFNIDVKTACDIIPAFNTLLPYRNSSFQGAENSMALKGNFENFYLNSIMQLLHNDKKTGVFRATNGEDEAFIYFNEGAVTYAIGSQREARLGYLLKKRGLISAEKLKSCLASAKEKKQALGKYLLENGDITLDELNEMLAKQTEVILFNLFKWEKGDFEYKDTQVNLKGLVNVKINVLKIILEASRRIDEMSIFNKQIPNENLIFKISEQRKDQEEIKLNSAELQMLTIIDGEKTVADIFKGCGYDAFAPSDQFTAYKTLHSLISSGLIEINEETQPEDEAIGKDVDYISIITVYNEVLQTVCRHLESELGKKIINILEECKSEVVTRPINLFEGFHPDNPTATNMHTISGIMKAYEEDETNRALLIESFNKFILGILDKAENIIGRRLTRNVMLETEKILSHFKETQFKKSSMSQVIDNLITTLQRDEQHGQGKNRTD
ncbi:MAG: DUF4388 domain-containing protein [Planctomycetota bacterium]